MPAEAVALSPERPDAARVRKLRGPLLRWYRRHRRDLPWRRTRDPYAIWVSEVMLQQTQVATVLPYYRRFLERFPDPASLANAAEEEVLGLWSGLGYYRRARALRAGARAVVERHAGRVPGDVEALRALPGIGRYTAGAIASIAFDLPAPVLDGNVRRVLSRLWALKVAARAREEKLLWAIAEILAPGPDPGDLNQALMELGARVCTPRNPDCPACPLRNRCRALELGDPEAHPTPRSRRPTEKVTVAVGWIRRSRRLLLEKPPPGSPLRGSWDLPAVELCSGGSPRDVLRRKLKREHHLEVTVGDRLTSVGHGIMHRRLSLDGYDCRAGRGRIAGRADLRWLPPAELSTAAVSGATRKIARAVIGDA